MPSSEKRKSVCGLPLFFHVNNEKMLFYHYAMQFPLSLPNVVVLSNILLPTNQTQRLLYTGSYALPYVQPTVFY